MNEAEILKLINSLENKIDSHIANDKSQKFEVEISNIKGLLSKACDRGDAAMQADARQDATIKADHEWLQRLHDSLENYRSRHENEYSEK